MKNKDSILTFGFHKESGQNISMLTLNENSRLLCPECFESYLVRHQGYISAELHNERQMESGEYAIDLNFAPKVDYYCVCKTCGKMVSLIQVDRNMADAIRILNRNNYKTISCCEGHSNDVVKRMFIKFAPDVRLSSIPAGWEIDTKDCTIECKYTVEMQKEQALSYLYEWVHSISRKSEDGSDWNYEEWKKEKGD